MKIMKYFKYNLPIIFVFLLSSCLNSGLDDLPSFEEANITDVKFDVRYKDYDDLWIDGEPTVKVVSLSVGNKVIDAEKAMITCTLLVPAADGSFTKDIRDKVSLTSIVGKFNLSTAASIAPIDGAPILGVPGDFSSKRKYKVMAANGSAKEWTIEVISLNK